MHSLTRSQHPSSSSNVFERRPIMPAHVSSANGVRTGSFARHKDGSPLKHHANGKQRQLLECRGEFASCLPLVPDQGPAVNEDEGTSFLRAVASLIIDESKVVGSGARVKSGNQCLVDFKKPLDLEREFDFKIKDGKAGTDELLDFCRATIKYSIKTTHPGFYNQLYAGVDGFSLAGAWLSDALNTSQATYETSPVFTLLETNVLRYLASYCGWQKDSVDGIFAPGGSLANIYGLLLARFNMFPEVKEKGVSGLGRLVILTSEDSHYSIVKGSMFMGMGTQSVVKVKSDGKGCMDPGDLELCIEKCLRNKSTPFMVCCTAGTTVLSAFDPIDKIASIAKRYGIWVHVDAALGGTALFSQAHRHLLRGIEQADSVTWNMHKLGGIPLQCSAFITNHPTILSECNGLNAEYLFQNDKFYDASYDSGDKSIQCGRKVDSLKLWVALMARGKQEMERMVDHVFAMAQYLTEKMRETPGFQLVLPEYQGTTVSFWYIPKCIRKEDGSLPDPEVLHRVAPLLKAEMMRESRIMVNYQPLTSKALPNFFRTALTCVPEPTEQDLDTFVDEIVRLGEKIKI